MKDRIVRFVLIINFVSLSPFSVQAIESGINDTEYQQDDGVTGEYLMKMAGRAWYAEGGLIDTAGDILRQVQEVRETIGRFLEGEKISMSHFAIKPEEGDPCQISFHEHKNLLPPFAKLSSVPSPIPNMDKCETEDHLEQAERTLFAMGWTRTYYAEFPMKRLILSVLGAGYRAVKSNPQQLSQFSREMLDDTLWSIRSSSTKGTTLVLAGGSSATGGCVVGKAMVTTNASEASAGFTIFLTGHGINAITNPVVILESSTVVNIIFIGSMVICGIAYV